MTKSGTLLQEAEEFCVDIAPPDTSAKVTHGQPQYCQSDSVPCWERIPNPNRSLTSHCPDARKTLHTLMRDARSPRQNVPVSWAGSVSSAGSPEHSDPQHGHGCNNPCRNKFSYNPWPGTWFLQHCQLQFKENKDFFFPLSFYPIIPCLQTWTGRWFCHL